MNIMMMQHATVDTIKDRSLPTLACTSDFTTKDLGSYLTNGRYQESKQSLQYLFLTILPSITRSMTVASRRAGLRLETTASYLAIDTFAAH